MELWEKVLVSQKFFATEHGAQACEECHGGAPTAVDRVAAHQGIVKDPTIKTAGKVCGECHEEIVKTATTSLHATLSTFPKVLRARTGDDAAAWEKIDTGRGNHCAGCHSSCGQCHVSRPKFSKSGFVNGHVFSKATDMVNQCTACHGSRVGDEYFGDRGIGDVHLAKRGLDCSGCHTAAEMHASGEGLTSRYQLPQLPKCQQCHAAEQLGKVAQHQDHAGKVQCQVCHAQDYINCNSCHTGKDGQGLAYFQNEHEFETFKIGRNYPGTGLTEKWVLVRHVPADREVFDFYVKDGFKSFDAVPTWKRASPHNIQRKTWRTQACNNCHGQRGLFLSDKDLLPYDRAANAPVVVADAEVPAARAEAPAPAAAPAVKAGMLISAEALHELLGRKEQLVVVDARTPDAYQKGHIEGAVNVNVMAELRYPPDATPRAMTMKSPEELAQLFGSRGIDQTTRVVVYDAGGLEAPFLVFALTRLGNPGAALLDGGVDGWKKEAKLPLVAGAPAPALPRTFTPAPNAAALLNNRQLAAAAAEAGTVVVDVRSIPQYTGLRRHPLVQSQGHVEPSVNLSVRGLITPEGFVKDPRAAAWLLESRGITRDKRVIATCNTGQQAAGAWFALTWLGYPNVAVHDGSWVSWERSPMMKK